MHTVGIIFRDAQKTIPWNAEKREGQSRDNSAALEQGPASPLRNTHNNVSSSIRWPKYWSFSFSISPSNEYSGLIETGMQIKKQ